MTIQDAVVELFYSGVWNVAPAYVRDPISITRGRRDEQTQLGPSSATLTLDDRQEVYNPRNPMSVALYGKAGRNTPIRITVAGGQRFIGEVASWKPGRTLDFDRVAGRGDAWCEIEAAGILRRVGTDPLDSPLRRAITAATPTAYWPLEDSDGALSAQSAVDGVPDMTPFGYSRFTAPVTGDPVPAAGLPRFGTGNGIPGSAPVVDLSQGGVLQGAPPVSTSVGWRVEFVLICPRDKADNRIAVRWLTNGTWDTWDFQVEAGGIFATFGTGLTALGSVTASFNIFDGLPHHYAIEAEQLGGATSAALYVDGEFVEFYDAFVPPMTGSPGSITSVIVNPLEEINGTAAMPIIGHVAVWNPHPVAAPDHTTAMRGHHGEATTARFTRLCDELDVTSAIAGGAPADTLTMGAQRVDTLTGLLGETERTDDGFIFEPRTLLGLAFRPGANVQNQAATLVLDWAGTEVAPPLAPLIDDQLARNDVVAVSTTSGASARSVEESGRMSVQAPPNGIGRKPGRVDVNPAADVTLIDHASWHRHKGTADEVRFAQITVDLLAHPGLTTDAAAVDVGHRIDLVNVPVSISPGTVSLIVIGYTEVIGAGTRKITYVCAPASPYVTATADGDPRVPADGSTLAALMNDSDMTFSLASTAANGPWVTGDTVSNPTDFPLSILIGGELATASAISGASSPQTVTLSARALNGVNRQWAAGTPVDVAVPAVAPL